jgi:hypothetical protein
MHSLTFPRIALCLIGLLGCLALVADGRAGEPTQRSRIVPPIEMRPGQSYAGGTRVRIPKGAASFVVPTGWHAQLPEDSDAIIAVSDSGAGFVMVFMVLNLTEEELTALLREPQPITHDLVFDPVGTVVKRGNRLTASYRGGSLEGRAVAIMGPDRQGVLFFLGRPPTDASQPDLVLDELADSTEFAVPKELPRAVPGGR